MGKKPPLIIPPTRNHHQLAKWINASHLADSFGRSVTATVFVGRVSTDSKIAGTRFRRAGRGRKSLQLKIYAANPRKFLGRDELYEHESGETYRRHTEARAWVAANLHHTGTAK
jgi:hypothetical protein